MSKNPELCAALRSACLLVSSFVAVGTPSILLVHPVAPIARQSKELIEQARNAGIPLSADDLPGARAVPPAQNAGIAYRKLDATYRGFEVVFRNYDRPGTFANAWLQVHKNKADTGERQIVTDELNSLKPALDSAERASHLPFCDLGWDYEHGIGTELNGLQAMRELIELFTIKARMQSLEGDYYHAFDSIATGYRIDRQLGSIPEQNCCFAAASKDRDLASEILFALKRCQKDASVLRKARDVIDDLPTVPDIRTAMGGAVVVNQATYDTFKTYQDIYKATSMSPDNKDEHDTVPLLLSSEFRSDIKSRNLKLWIGIYGKVPKAAKTWSELQDGLEAADQLVAALGEKPAFEDKLASIFTPNLEMLGSEVGRAAAYHHLAGTCVRLLQDRLSKGVFPDALPDYGGTSKDPIDDKPLRYKPSGSGFVIYSVGSDREDNGGVDPGNKVGFAAPGNDIVWDFSH